MVANLLNFISLAILFISTPINALSVVDSSVHIARHQVIARNIRQSSDTLAKRSSRCKARPTSSATHTSTTLPAHTSSPAPSPSPSPPANQGSSSAKVAIAWAMGNDPALGKLKTSKVSMMYNWGSSKPSNLYGMDFVPMLWGYSQLDDFKRLVVPGYAKYALGFNEPDIVGQSTMSPSDAVSLWWSSMEPLKSQGYDLISPAVTSGVSGKAWLMDFINRCKGCNIDIVAVHWYGIDAQAFIDYLIDFHTTFGKNLWVTEFACWNFADLNKQATDDEVLAFINKVTGFMDQTSWIHMYSPFGFMHDMGNVGYNNQLINTDGSPNKLGWAYLT